MAFNLKLNAGHLTFLFDKNDHLNIFNLVRLFRSNNDNQEIIIDVSEISTQHQESIAVKFTVFLNLYVKLVSNIQGTGSLIYSNIRQELIDKLDKEFTLIQDNEVLIFELNCQSSQKEKPKDPHLVKNARGAVLLSLVQDLLDSQCVGNQFSIFDEKSSLLLHSASDFLHNEENALMMWNVLKIWETEHETAYKAEINRRIKQSLIAKKELEESFTQLTKQVSTNTSFATFIKVLQSKIGLQENIYVSSDNLHIWFVDDQHANGWYKLMKRIIPDSNINLEALNGIEDVNILINLSSFSSSFIIPDLALVDLRLSDSDQLVENYNAQDLSGFKVVDLLLKQWSGLPIMITSASSKLWNMEKAIERGAVAYWRKSDEVTDSVCKNSVLTAFDINLQFIEKLTLVLKRARYKYIFRIIESLRTQVKSPEIKSVPLQRCIENYAIELEQKTSWMCWKKTDEIKINDSLYLGVMEIFNEIEPLLFDHKNKKLVLFPGVNTRGSSANSDSQVINDTLDSMDSKYDIRGLGLSSRYVTCKSIRNKLPIIHGSEAENNIRHATLVDIETLLLIIWCLLNEIGALNPTIHVKTIT
ncbi:Uncharacterised protein [Shewanella putrefaciens]|uniref:response regulator n=1 Tax=Shewanella putrefaciens TaxID=24 RepID=UPI000E05BAF6|nr:response regulator [Shewanella putrefaciens]SUI88365.1 Uncharacterised protein [Shewanella putrefaciens]